jgi:hypothetical protein
MSPREFELDEALDKYEKEKEETKKAGGVEAEQKEFEISRKEKKLKKPGSVSRFFNQFGIGKYWERLNDYFEQEEQMEREEAEREASKETAGDIKAAVEEKVSAVKEAGTKMPTKILESAARAGARAKEAAPVVAEVKAEAAQIEQEAEAAKTDLGEDIEILEQGSMKDELKEKYEDRPARDVDLRIKSLESNIRSEKNLDMRELLEAERNILVEIKKEKEPAKVPGKKIEVKLPPWDEEEGLKDLPPGEEFEAIAKEHKERAVPSPEEVKAVEVLEEAVEEPVEEEMEKEKIKPVFLKKQSKRAGPPSIEEIKPVEVLSEEIIGAEQVPAWDDVKPITSKEIEEMVKAGRWKPKISKGLEERQPEIFDAMEEAFFAKGEKGSKARLERMLDSLEKVGQAYAAQKTAKEISAQDEKALKKWIAETKGAIDVLKKAPEMKPEKVVELKKRKPAKRRAA